VKGTYSPLSRPLFLYVNTSAAKRPAVRDFLMFDLQNAGTLATHVKYIPLPERRTSRCATTAAAGRIPG
jgi:phosphate transport system substrate-binding protein